MYVCLFIIYTEAFTTAYMYSNKLQQANQLHPTTNELTY